MAATARVSFRRRATAFLLGAVLNGFVPASAVEPESSDGFAAGPAPLRLAQAPAGSAVEAIPEVPTPPEFRPPIGRPETAAGLPPAARPTVFLKKSTARYTLLAGGGDVFGIDALDAETTIAFRDIEPLTITPSLGTMFLDGPTRTDAPPRLHTGQVEFRWFGQIAEPVFYEVAFMPALFTDGDNVTSDALRLQGRGVGYLAFSERTQFVLGATYLDRKDYPILPIFGVLLAPRDDLKLELVFPRPRTLKRVRQDGRGETWAYVAGELGGGSWAIQRQDDGDDVFTFRDYRLLFGMEQRQTESWTANLEAGYVFGREVEYAHGSGDYSPDSTFLLRVAVSR